MRGRRRTTTVLALLGRLGRPAPESWTVSCRDEQGRKTKVRIGVSTAGVTIDGPRHEHLQLTLTPLEIGRLRGALRDALQVRAPLVPAEPPPPRGNGRPSGQRPPTTAYEVRTRQRWLLTTGNRPIRIEGVSHHQGRPDYPQWPSSDPDRDVR